MGIAPIFNITPELILPMQLSVGKYFVIPKLHLFYDLNAHMFVSTAPSLAIVVAQATSHFLNL